MKNKIERGNTKEKREREKGERRLRDREKGERSRREREKRERRQIGQI